MLSLVHNAGSHNQEVSSGLHGHQAATKARSPSRFSKEAPAGNTEQEALSLQTLAAAADSGVFLLWHFTATSSVCCHQSSLIVWTSACDFCVCCKQWGVLL